MNLDLLKHLPLYSLVFIPFVGCTLITADLDTTPGETGMMTDPECEPDATEDSGSEFIPFDEGTVIDNNICPRGDVDVYMFTITDTTPQSIEILLTLDGIESDLDMSLYQGRSTFPDSPIFNAIGDELTDRVPPRVVDTSVENEFLIEVFGTREPTDKLLLGGYSLTLNIPPEPTAP